MPKFINRRRLAKDAQMVLSDLGTNAEEVASSLASYGVDGRYENSSVGLITLYLNAVMGGDRRICSVEVAGRWAQIRTGKSQAIVVDLPAAVSEFMFVFDARDSCFGTNAPRQSEEGPGLPASNGPDESSGNPVRDDGSADR